MHPSLSIYDLNGTHLHIKTSVSIGEKEKICTYGKRRVHRLGPFCHRRSTQPSRSLLNTNGTYIENKTLVSIKKRKVPMALRARMWMVGLEMHLQLYNSVLLYLIN